MPISFHLSRFVVISKVIMLEKIYETAIPVFRLSTFSAQPGVVHLHAQPYNPPIQASLFLHFSVPLTKFMINKGIAKTTFP